MTTASEKLKELHAQRVIPVFRKTNTILAGADAFTRARDIEALIDALPQIVTVIEAAEDGRGHSLMLQSEPAGVEMVGWSLKRAQKLHAALAALESALS